MNTRLVRLVLTILLMGVSAALWPATAAAHVDPDVPIPGVSIADRSTVPPYSEARQPAGAGTLPSPSSGTEGTWDASLGLLISGGAVLALGAGAVRVAVTRRRAADSGLGYDHMPVDDMDSELRRIVDEDPLPARTTAGSR